MMERTDKPEVKLWARQVFVDLKVAPATNFPVLGKAYEVKYPCKMYADAQDVPAAELCVWSGYLAADAVRKLYREA